MVLPGCSTPEVTVALRVEVVGGLNFCTTPTPDISVPVLVIFSGLVTGVQLCANLGACTALACRNLRVFRCQAAAPLCLDPQISGFEILPESIVVGPQPNSFLWDFGPLGPGAGLINAVFVVGNPACPILDACGNPINFSCNFQINIGE